MVEAEPPPVPRTVEIGPAAIGGRRAELAGLLAAWMRAGGASLLDATMEFRLTLFATRH
jgi:hypothetical protein